MFSQSFWNQGPQRVLEHLAVGIAGQRFLEKRHAIRHLIVGKPFAAESLDRSPVEILAIDDNAVRGGQIARIERVRRRRDPRAWEAALDALRKVARTGDGNMLTAAVEAARARATLGEISDALRDAFGDHTAVPKVVRDIYGSAYGAEPEYTTLVARLSELTAELGARPRIMVAKLGQDGHDRGAKVISSAFGDLGFEVIAGPLFQTPEEAANLAILSKVHVLGMSSLAAGHRTLAPQLIKALRAPGGHNIIVVVGGVIPRQDYQFLLECGAAAVF